MSLLFELAQFARRTVTSRSDSFDAHLTERSRYSLENKLIILGVKEESLVDACFTISNNK